MVKKILIIMFATIMLTVTNCFATNIMNEEFITKDNIEYIKRSYSVPMDQEDDFLVNLENEFKIENKTYQIQDKNRTGGDIVETIDINTTKTITLDSNNTEYILSQLPQEMDYNENGYGGKYVLNTNSINAESKYNGYKEVLVKDTKIYTDLDKNDLDNIPKQIKKDGLILDLLTTNWEVTETKKLQDNIIPSKYKATCYYATKKKVNNPITYIVTANYTGTAEKVIENDYTYEITYKCIGKDKNILPILAITGGSIIFIIVILFARKKNVIIYNFQNKEWKEVGKQRISKPMINLNRYNYKSVSNRYKINLDEKIVEKYNGKMINIKRNKKTIGKFINKANNIKPYTIEIVI